ncbi:Sec-independent protein translocase protein TatB [Pseudomonas massiliensis]|uniref:Sec-independent protein translocase protein TatB n=1 Tax=Pseudomonas massiliensis TaxID=522492 RepID=UPI00058F65C9|nr:Sec-independent protein translocase protein TatB [Pseudomonas massiliensis]
MFGISFSELLLVGLVALLVLGPERLPGAARTAGLWIGRLKRSFNSIKTEIERELGADEIRRQLHNEHILSLEQEARRLMDPAGGNQAAPTIHPAPPTAPPVGDNPGTPAIAPVTSVERAPAATPAASPNPVTEPAAAPRTPQDSTPAP